MKPGVFGKFLGWFGKRVLMTSARFCLYHANPSRHCWICGAACGMGPIWSGAMTCNECYDRWHWVRYHGLKVDWRGVGYCPESSWLPSVRRIAIGAISCIVFAFIVWLAASANGQDTEPKLFHLIPTARQANVGGLGPVLADIDSHMPRNHEYRDSDPVTWGHETTHGINTNGRNLATSGNNAFYVLEDRMAFIHEPPLTIADIEPLVPPTFRGTLYRDYISKIGREELRKRHGVTNAEDWDGQPLYILDEWVAYTNGTAVAVDLSSLGWKEKRSDTVSNMLIFCAYATALLQAVERFTDPAWDHARSYPDKGKLIAFVEWNLARCLELYEQSKDYPNLSDDKHGAIVSAFLAEYAAEGE